VPAGFTEDQRGAPGGFVGDPDIFDTWATSSLTPQIAACWQEDGTDLWDRVFPMDVRPQGHDIIRTWLFSTVVRSHHEFGEVPWTNAALSGWILDPDRKKMSKSKGNVVTPIALFEQYGTDAVRYWAASARPGVDTAFSEEQMKVGRKFANKLLNVTRFVLGFGEVDSATPPQPTPVDQWMLARLDEVIIEATRAFEAFDYARALERTEEFFWWFCDDYVELVKGRAYGSAGPEAADAARQSLLTALDAIQRLLAPFLPFATEEAWSWWQTGSVHKAPWPVVPEGTTHGDHSQLNYVCEVMAQVRRAKTEAQTSQKTPVARLVVAGPAAVVDAVKSGQRDLTDAGSIVVFEYLEADSLQCTIDL
jgi:valyl-tRNA synthetase